VNAMSESKEIKLKGKQEVTAQAEQTTPGVVFTPLVDIFETEKTITLLADLPGVKADRLNIDLRDDVITIIGDISPEEGKDEEDLAVEYETGRYYRQFTLSEVIDQNKIDAKLTDGVLRLTLPKVEKATPRKIAIKAA
jgi:HSP20 family molecular chaperone IbpA